MKTLTRILFMSIISVSISGCIFSNKQLPIHESLTTTHMSKKPKPKTGERYSAKELADQLNTSISEHCDTIEKLDRAVFYLSKGSIRLSMPPAYEERC